jgi:enoyl-CoA hydratase/carnithine racemase
MIDIGDQRSSSPLLTERDGPLMYITFNRPDKLNAFTPELRELLVVALDEAAQDDAVRVVILRGAGRAFSAGNDHESVSRGGSGTVVGSDNPLANAFRLEASLNQLLKVWDHPKPVIAQVHGYCFAQSMVLAALCDVTIVAEDAQIGWPKLPIGGGLLSPAVVHLIGPKRAKEMSFVAGNSFDGVTAAEWGWANRAVAADRLEATVRDIALSMCAYPAPVLRAKKLAINRVVEATGFRQLLMLGPYTDSLVHASPEIAAIRRRVAEVGLKAALGGALE